MYAKIRIISLKESGISNKMIQQILAEENVMTTSETIRRFWKRYNFCGSIDCAHSSGRKSKATANVLEIIDSSMTENDETTAKQLQLVLKQQGIDISESSILRFRRKLGWKYCGARYCQVIREQNKLKRYEWALSCLLKLDNF